MLALFLIAGDNPYANMQPPGLMGTQLGGYQGLGTENEDVLRQRISQLEELNRNLRTQLLIAKEATDNNEIDQMKVLLESVTNENDERYQMIQDLTQQLSEARDQSLELVRKNSGLEAKYRQEINMYRNRLSKYEIAVDYYKRALQKMQSNVTSLNQSLSLALPMASSHPEIDRAITGIQSSVQEMLDIQI